MRLLSVHNARDGGRDGNGFVGGREQCQDGLGEVALVGDLPFVVGLDGYRAGQPPQRGGVGERPWSIVRNTMRHSFIVSEAIE